MAEMSVDVEMPLAQPSSETDPDYLRWSCERLQHMLDQEEARRVGLERKAGAATAFSLALASLYAKQIAGFSSWTAVTVVPTSVALGFLLFALLFTYRTVAVREHKAPNPGVLCDDDVRLQPPSVSYLGYQLHLQEAVVALRRQHRRKATDSDRAQQWALLAAASFVIALLIHAIEVAPKLP